MSPLEGYYRPIWEIASPQQVPHHWSIRSKVVRTIHNLALIVYVIDPCSAGENWIEVLPEDVLLVIFDFYRLYSTKKSRRRPWKWHRLAHVCRKWRHVISRSTRRLGLQILCECTAPIGDILDSWPTLPLVVKFWAGKPLRRRVRRAGFKFGNLMIALRYPDRLYEIDLHVTSSMLASIIEVTQKPCQVLEIIRITVKAPTSSSILDCSAFLGGSAPHLREIKLDGVPLPFTQIRQVLLSTNDLVELHLANIPNDVCFSPSDLVTGLSTSAQLKRLTVDFHSPPFSPPPSMTHSPPRSTTLPSLMFLDFHGASEFMEEFVGRIELPALCNIAVRLFNDMLFEIPQFCRFIPCLNALRPPARVIVIHSVDSVGVYFEAEEHPSENCFFGTSCRQLDWQLSFVTQILSQLSSLLSGVHSLDIRSDELPTGEEDVDSTQWLELLQPFTHVTEVHVREELVPGIVQALAGEDMTAEVLPELSWLRLDRYRSSPSVMKAAGQFVATRKLSGRPIFLSSGSEVSHFLLPYYTLVNLSLTGSRAGRSRRSRCSRRLG